MIVWNNCHMLTLIINILFIFKNPNVYVWRKYESMCIGFEWRYYLYYWVYLTVTHSAIIKWCLLNIWCDNRIQQLNAINIRFLIIPFLGLSILFYRLVVLLRLKCLSKTFSHCGILAICVLWLLSEYWTWTVVLFHRLCTKMCLNCMARCAVSQLNWNNLNIHIY